MKRTKTKQLQHKAKRLTAFLGAWGFQAHNLKDNDELIKVAAICFEYSGTMDLAEITDFVSELGKKERFYRIVRAVAECWPQPCALWPAKAMIRGPVRRLLGQGSADIAPSYATETEYPDVDLKQQANANATREAIMAAQSERGGWTRAQLEEWGVPWPPPKGWKQQLIRERRLG